MEKVYSEIDTSELVKPFYCDGDAKSQFDIYDINLTFTIFLIIFLIINPNPPMG